MVIVRGEVFTGMWHLLWLVRFNVFWLVVNIKRIVVCWWWGIRMSNRCLVVILFHRRIFMVEGWEIIFEGLEVITGYFGAKWVLVWAGWKWVEGLLGLLGALSKANSKVVINVDTMRHIRGTDVGRLMSKGILEGRRSLRNWMSRLLGKIP